MMPSIDWGSMWLFMVLPSIVVGAVIVAIVLLFLRHDKTGPSTLPTSSAASGYVAGFPGQSLNPPAGVASTPLGEVFRSLSPTLMDDEKRVMGELAGAGGEVLQSDLPRMTDFSKATVSKVIHSLEVRGIVVREKHKWTYWCKINPRLVDRIQRGEISPGSHDLEPPQSHDA